MRKGLLQDVLRTLKRVLSDNAGHLTGIDLLLLHELLFENGELFRKSALRGKSFKEKYETIFAGPDVAKQKLNVFL